MRNKEMTAKKETAKEMESRIKVMELSQIITRLDEIQNILKNNSGSAIDTMIPLLEETKLLKAKADTMVGEIDAYLSEQEN